MIGFVIIAAIAVAIGIWGTVTCTLIISPQNALICKRVSVSGGILGIALAAIMLTVYSINISLYSKSDGQVIRDIFFVFLTVASIAFVVCFAVAYFSALLKNKMHLFVPLLCGLWSVLILLWTYICCSWSVFPEFTLYPFVLVYGISLCLVLMLPSVPVLSQRHRMLSDSEYVQAILDERKQKKEAKHQKREKAKITAEKKKRLKNPKKQS